MAEREIVPGARSEVLARIRAALADGGPEVGAAAPPPGARIPDRVERFAARVAEHRAGVRRTDAAGLPALLATVAAEHGARRLAAPAGLPAEWTVAGVELVGDDPPLTPRQLDGLDGVLTASALGIAETGTVVLDHGPGQGRRALTLLPDLHVCVVAAADLVDDVGDAIATLGATVAAGLPVTMISGPSATSDIELSRVEGVHGPRRVEVVLLEGASGTAVAAPASP